MVERLKIAVEKARTQRQKLHDDDYQSERPGPTAVSRKRTSIPKAQTDVSDAKIQHRDMAWNALEAVELDARKLERSRVISYAKDDPTHVSFDILRTRMQGAFENHGWSRVGITSPTQGCGKTFSSANLAFSLARQSSCRTVLMDMDMRQPSLAGVLGVQNPNSLRWFLTGEVSTESFFSRAGSNLALGLGSGRIQDASELIQAPGTAHALGAMQTQLAPDVVIYDLPPMLSCDDVMGFLPQLDCVLLVVGGGVSKPTDVSECETLLKDQCPILGIVLNKAEGVETTKYKYY